MFGPSFPETHGGVVMVVWDVWEQGAKRFENIFQFSKLFPFFIKEN